MALLFLGKTECPICRNVIIDEESAYLFPAFINNTKDILYQFNDSAFHIECLKKHSLGNRAIEFANQFIFRTRPENRICSVGGNKIQNFDDYIFISMLTSNEREELFDFNFTTLDRNNLKQWGNRQKFIEIASKFYGDGKWGDMGAFKYLNHLIDKVHLSVL